MIRVLIPLTGDEAPHVIEAFDSPEDCGLDALAKVIVDTVNINAVLGRPAV